MTDDDPPKPSRCSIARRRPAARPKRTRLSAAVPTPGGSPRRYYDIGYESAEDIALIMMADLFADEARKAVTDGDTPSAPDLAACCHQPH